MLLHEGFPFLWLEQVFLIAKHLFCSVPLPLMVIAIPVASLLLWRLFRFTLVPFQYPTMPKELPYWFPFIGHSWAFFKDPVKLVETGIDFTNRTREPFAIQVMGRTFYTITTPEHVAAAYKASTTLSFDSFLDETLRVFGLDAVTLKLIRHEPSPGDACYHESNPVNPQQKPFVHWIKDIYRQALLPGDKMNHMAANFDNYLDRNLQWNRVSSFALNQVEKQKSIRLSLKDFTRTIMLEAITNSLFGTRLAEIEPNIIKYAAEFNDEAWMLVYHYPKLFASRVFGNRMKIMAALDRYRKIPEEARAAGGEAWSIKTLITAGELFGMTNQNNDTFLMLIHWAATANTTWLCFWLLSYLLWDKPLMARIQREIALAFQQGKLDLAYLLSSCPLLDSVFFETLRLGGGTVSVRTVKSPIMIGGKLLEAGGEVLIMHRVLHSNENVWGDSAACFDPERFLKNKALSAHASYRPFGGGSTYCPGRVIARQQVYIFLALMLDRLDLELAPDQKFPLLDNTQPSVGVTGPRPDMDLYVTVSERARFGTDTIDDN